jgi:hypothetical protein
MKQSGSFARIMMFSAFLAATGIWPSSAQSNDSVAHLASGGLVLARSNDIEMQSEELYVSFDKIRVHYRFWNTSDQDIETLVAFPMPDLGPMIEGNDYSIPTQSPDNFLAFQTSVDGVPIHADIEQKAYGMAIDRTDMLNRLGVPLAPHLETTSIALAQLASSDLETLLSLGLIREEVWDVGQGIQKSFQPNWTLRTTYYWNQVFPARTQIEVSHEYQPSIGASASSMIGYEGTIFSSENQMTKDYCIDNAFFQAAGKAHKRAAANNQYLTEKRLEYILETGANWSGPIHKFRLIVDKGSTKNLVSFCGTGLKKISPTQFEMREENYWPSQNLHVLLLEPVG